MSFKLTFNKPAVRQFIEGEEAGGLRIKIQDGAVMFMPVPTDDAPDTAKLMPRTRGGVEAVVDGSESDKVLKHLKNQAGPFFVLKRFSKDWVVAEPYTGKDAPPKFEPHVRVWSPALKAANPAKQSKTSTQYVAPTSVAAETTAPHALEAFDQIATIKWAYQKLAEPPRPGRPDKETLEARSIRDRFESTDIQTIISAYNTLGNHLRKVVPEAIDGSETSRGRQVRVQEKSFAPARGHRLIRSTAPIVEAPQSADDLESEAQVRQALQKLGLEEPKVVPRARRTKMRTGFSEAAA